MLPSMWKRRAILDPLTVITLATIGLGCVQDVPATGEERDWALLASLMFLFVTTLLGRVQLSWLPPGRVGGHGVAELPLTWAASHLLGFVTFPLWFGFLINVSTEFGQLTLFGPWIVLALIRLATRPAAMAPRHVPPSEPLSPGWSNLRFAVRGAFFFLVVLVGSTPRDSSGSAKGLFDLEGGFDTNLISATHLLALGIFLDHGLKTLRLAPLARLLAWTVCVSILLAFFQHPNVQLSTLGHTAGVCFAIAWWLRASERSLWLSIFGWLAVGLSGLFVNALGGLLLLLAVTAAPSRVFVLWRIAVPACLVLTAMLRYEPISVGDFSFTAKSLNALLPIFALLLGSMFARKEAVN